MLGNRQFYHETIRKIIVAFGTLFNDIHIVRKNNSGAVIQSMKGAGTNEKLFFDTMNQLDVSQKTQVKAKVLELSGSTLESWVQGDFCGWLDTRTSAGKKMCEDAKAVIQTPITNGASST